MNERINRADNPLRFLWTDLRVNNQNLYVEWFESLYPSANYWRGGVRLANVNSYFIIELKLS
jgi:hypothetical protein